MTPSSLERLRSVRPLLPFLLVVAVGVFELGAHVVQVRRVITDKEWTAARDAVKELKQPGDLVVFAPAWTDPLGREVFGEDLVPLTSTARADESTFPRTIEVSSRGTHLAWLRDWRKVEERRSGPFTLGIYENPSPAKVLDDLFSHAGQPGKMSVSEVTAGQEQDCRWGDFGVQSGGLGHGATVPAQRYSCARTQSFVGVSVITTIDYGGHRCFYAPPPSSAQSLVRIRFTDVAFGHAIHGFHGLDVHAERDRTGPPVNLDLRAGGRLLMRLVHRDGDGWKGFEIATEDLAGTRGELIAEISSSGAGRKYCFEADTR
jgi:hypothetical protein